MLQRLRAVRPFVSGNGGRDAALGQSDRCAAGGHSPSRLLGDEFDEILTALLRSPGQDKLWLLCVAVTGTFPMSETVLAAARSFLTTRPIDAARWMLHYARTQSEPELLAAEIRVVAGGGVAVRSAGDAESGPTGAAPTVEGFEPVDWLPGHRAFRAGDGAVEGRLLVVPWHSTVLVTGAGPTVASDVLLAMARHSANRLEVVQQTFSPVLEADRFPSETVNCFARHLAVVKHAARVVCTDHAVAEEMRGFAAALAPQGLRPPEISEVPEHADVPEIAGIPVRDQKRADPRANLPAPAWPAPRNRARQDGRAALERALAAMPPSSRERMVSSLRTFLAAVGQEVPDGQDLVLQTLEKVFEEAPKGACWLLRAVLEARVPSADAVDEFERLLSGDGVLGAIAILLGTSVFASDAGPRVVEVLAGRVVVDVHHTSATDLSTGIQRVARETTRRWADRHDVVLVGWGDGYRGMRRLDASERDRLFRGGAASSAGRAGEEGGRPAEERGVAAEASTGGTLGAGEPVLIPWRCTHVLPEIPGDEHRPRLYKALALHSAASTAMIGFDCVPLTTAETTADAMPAVFCSFLAAAAHFDKVAAISNASATEFLGWKQMLGPSGLTGPEVRAVSLPVEVREPSSEALAEARHRIAIGNLPTVLVVGSHEPRKNHVAVVNAAERLWREGMSFSLTFIGGNSWKSEEFQSMVQNLRWHRPIGALRALSDELLWAAYRLAYCTVFVSLHEGFGLPLAESLASRTPAVTSDRGSMAELADEGGALVVDPRDDDAIANALRRLLRSRTYRDRLAAELEGRRWKTWEEYAAELWDFLVEKSPPVAGTG